MLQPLSIARSIASKKMLEDSVMSLPRSRVKPPVRVFASARGGHDPAVLAAVRPDGVRAGLHGDLLVGRAPRPHPEEQPRLR